MTLHDLMAGIGYGVTFTSTVTVLFCIVGLCVSYCWRKWWDFDAIVRVAREANRQGIRLTKDQRGAK
jgi:hypothetical protein